MVRLLGDFVVAPRPDDLAWIDEIGSHPLLSKSNISAVEQEGAAILECVIRLQRIEKRLVEPPPAFNSAEELLGWYCGSPAHLMELDASEAYQFAEHITEASIREAIEEYFHAVPNGLKRRVRVYKRF